MHARSLVFVSRKYTRYPPLHQETGRVGPHELRQTRMVSFFGRFLDEFVGHSARKIIVPAIGIPLTNGNPADEFVTAARALRKLQGANTRQANKERVKGHADKQITRAS
jgi:hypothetical protein